MEKYEIHFVGSVLDSNTSGDEQAKIVALIEQGHSVALDLSGCSYVSSAGLRVMLYVFKLAKAKSRDVCLVGVSQEVKDVMHMTGFDKFFRFIRLSMNYHNPKNYLSNDVTSVSPCRWEVR